MLPILPLAMFLLKTRDEETDGDTSIIGSRLRIPSRRSRRTLNFVAIFSIKDTSEGIILLGVEAGIKNEFTGKYQLYVYICSWLAIYFSCGTSIIKIYDAHREANP